MKLTKFGPLGLILAASLVAAPAAAQVGQNTGLWVDISASAGSSRLTCDLCDTDRDLGGSIEYAFGAWAHPTLRVGVDLGFYTRSDNNARETVYSSGVLAAAYPRPGSGLHLIGGLGWAGFRAEDFSYDAVRLRLGAGWDLPITTTWVAGNRITVDAASFGSLQNGDQTAVESVGLSVVRFTLYIRRR